MLKSVFINLRELRENKAEKYVIYRGPIKKMRANGLMIVSDELIPSFKIETIQDCGLFYPSIEGFTNVDFACVLPEYQDVEHHVKNLLNKRKNAIIELLKSPDITNEKRKDLFDHMAKVFSYIYYNPDELEVFHTIGDEQFQKIKVPVNNRSPFSKTNLF